MLGGLQREEQVGHLPAGLPRAQHAARGAGQLGHGERAERAERAERRQACRGGAVDVDPRSSEERQLDRSEDPFDQLTRGCLPGWLSRGKHLPWEGGEGAGRRRSWVTRVWISWETWIESRLNASVQEGERHRPLTPARRSTPLLHRARGPPRRRKFESRPRPRFLRWRGTHCHQARDDEPSWTTTRRLLTSGGLLSLLESLLPDNDDSPPADPCRPRHHASFVGERGGKTQHSGGLLGDCSCELITHGSHTVCRLMDMI